MAQMCVLTEDTMCVECGECSRCDLNPEKTCDNCLKCVKSDADYLAIEIDEVIEDSEE
ncbi:hypothetical protein LJC33_07865 [Eubacteriales bacterium OttesenSCG-928-N13]|nr:hypothetical protein [Eubacteriales bacterium OttesenSCG-928-N13]